VKQSLNRVTTKQPKKHAAAVLLGRLGGLKGGKARARKLSATRRRAIAIKAIKTRWAKTKKLTKR
jgi:hypothetical protein